MTSKEKKRLAKIIEKHYWAHGQHLVIGTMECFQNSARDNYFSVAIKDGPYLFEIMNYNGLTYVDGIHKSYFRKDKFKLVEKFDSVTAAMQPLYFDAENVFTLKKFEPLTKEDIVHAVDYFVHEVLGMWYIFNLKFDETQEDYVSGSNNS